MRAVAVYDKWWPWRTGRIVARTKTTVTVRWEDGKVWKYDKAHQQFLSKKGKKKGEIQRQDH